jgi:TonB family protein
MAEPLSCGNFEGLALLYALGELEARARAGVEEHARVCPGCAAVLQRETALAGILAPGNRALGGQEPSDLLLAHCRSELAGTLDQAEAASRRRAWTSLFSPWSWIAALRFSPKFHPAWSVAALLMVAAVSGLAGWEGVGHAPLQRLGTAAVMTVSAAPPPPVTPTGQDAAPQASAPDRPVVNGTAEDNHVYAATDAGMNDAVSQSWFEGSAVPDQARLPVAGGPLGSEAAPHAWRHEPPLRMPAGLGPGAVWDAPASGRLAELSRSMDTLWWGGVRVDPAEQQKRLMLAPLPEYPEVARRAGIEGQVTLLLRIGKDGAVEDSELLSGEPVLGRAASEAVDQWRYSPLRIDGQPVNILTSVTLSFQLR